METRKGYDDLGRSITEVYRNGLLLSKNLTVESKLSQDVKQANKLYQEQVGHLKRLYQLKTQRLSVQDGTATARELDNQIVNTERLIEANNRVIASLDKQAVKRSRLINLSADEAAEAMKYAEAQRRAQEKLAAANQRKQSYNNSGLPELKKTQQAYSQLTTSYRQYLLAVKNGNEAGQAYWSQSALQAMNEIKLMEQKLPTLNLEEGVRKKILDLINQAKNAEATHQKNLEGLKKGTTELDKALNQIGSRLIQIVTTMLVLRGLTSLWRNATDYAQQYYDSLNEIRIVTGKTEQQVARLGQRYRAMAKEMNVSSSEIATAAVEFWRQGLDEDEVERR